MITNRQIERLWTAKSYGKLFQELMAARPESVIHLGSELSRPAAVSALAMVRMEELSQSHVPLYGRLLRSVLAAQEADGGWGDVASTALCIRALLCGGGDGAAIDRGLGYLANLQKAEGIWPAIPIRRMPEDSSVSLFVLHQLGDNARFRATVRFGDAIGWFEANAHRLDRDLHGFWERARGRCGGYVSRPTPVAA